MKKVLFSLLTIVSLVAGVTLTNAAQNTNDKFTVRFRENTLVVASTQMEEARIYSMQGKLLQKEKGKFAEFPQRKIRGIPPGARYLPPLRQSERRNSNPEN